MIAVWLVGPPRSVTSATTTLGSRPAVSAGARSSATQHGRLVGHRHAGLGLADEPGDHPALDVAQVGDPLGHQAAHAGEHGDERLDRRPQRRPAGRRRRVSCLRTAERSPLSRARPAVAVSTSAAAPEARPAFGGETLGRRRRRPRRSARWRSSSGRAEPSKAATAAWETSVRAQQDRAVGDAGDDRGSGQGALGGVVVVAMVTSYSRAPLDSQHIRA